MVGRGTKFMVCYRLKAGTHHNLLRYKNYFVLTSQCPPLSSPIRRMSPFSFNAEIAALTELRLIWRVSAALKAFVYENFYKLTTC